MLNKVVTSKIGEIGSTNGKYPISDLCVMRREKNETMIHLIFECKVPIKV